MESAPFIICLILTLFYLGVIVAWCVNWRMHKLQSSIPLHNFIGFTLVLQFVVIILLSVYFGNKPRGEDGSFTIAVFAIFSSILAEGVFFALLILIALGWCIIITHVTAKHIVNITTFVTIYVLLQVFSLFLDTFWGSLLVALIVLSMYFGLMYFVFTFTQFHIRRLIKSIRESQEANAPPVEPNTANSVQMGEFTSFVGETQPPVNTYPPPVQTYPPVVVQAFPVQQGYPAQEYPAQQPYPQPYPPPYPQPSGEQLYPQAQSEGKKASPTHSPHVVHATPPVASPPHSPHVVHATTYTIPQAPLSPLVEQTSPHTPTQPHRIEVQPNTDNATNTNNSNTSNTSNTTEFERIPEAQEKLKLFQLFYKLMIFYIITSIIFSYGHHLAGANLSYLRLISLFIFLCGLCMTFRLRSQNRYFYLVSDNE